MEVSPSKCITGSYYVDFVDICAVARELGIREGSEFLSFICRSPKIADLDYFTVRDPDRHSNSTVSHNLEVFTASHTSFLEILDDTVSEEKLTYFLDWIRGVQYTRIIGTYVVENSKDLHILIYPVADCHLEMYMEDRYIDESVPDALQRFFVCLTNTLAYLHRMLIKHMDIKPKNLLVRKSAAQHGPNAKIYLADFGIARSYNSALDAETCSPTPYTPVFAAPEVVTQAIRGFKADVFSMGCVFAEILSALAGSRDELLQRREEGTSDRSFQANIDAVKEYIGGLPLQQGTSAFAAREGCLKMLNADPDERPDSETLCQLLGAHLLGNGCCFAGADRLEAAVEK
ncbi:hypothetical protein SLS58_000618 [Diplodia intermedia]|uniref:Protein kinase domain-containing protein n=1 Tax=Diplodia intermedia TaxID=856260 RepID=A0ABR3U5I1_9PEZI